MTSISRNDNVSSFSYLIVNFFARARKFGFNFLKLRINESHLWIKTYRKRNEAILQHFLKFMPDSRLTTIKVRIESMEQNIYF